MGDQEKCKKRFKGIENFLRRVAFNLGNTPSQTEVKIISCIPIDVTDLQQKIIYLEKQLEEAKNADTDQNEAVVQTAICPTGFPPRPNSKSGLSDTGKVSFEQYAVNCLSKQKKSVVSFIFPSVNPKSNCMETETHTPEDSFIQESEDHHPFVTRKALFQKKKNAKKKKLKTHLVYYAQTNENNSPFNNRSIPKSRNTMKENDGVGNSIIADMVRRQCKPAPLDKFSDTTQFSSPICRDIDVSRLKPYPRESDVCSCCHGQFHNLDSQMTRHMIIPDPIPTHDAHINNRGAYYDSSVYDLIPVKEIPMKIKRENESKKKEIKRMVNIKCWPENIRTNPHSLSVNYHTITPNYRRKDQTNFNAKKEILNKKIFEKKTGNKVTNNFNKDSSTGCIDLGEVYIKPLAPKIRTPTIIEPTPIPLHKNAECLTTVINNTECHTITTKSIELVAPPIEDKTEETLNQIKSILQSVLIEVKTNTQLHTNVEEKQKRDAVVQKGVSQSNMLGMSGLLNSFTYSPYNMNPYVASCSRHMPSNSFCFNGVPPNKCLQNYPLFIQSPGRNMCAGCFRNSSHVAKTVASNKRAATTATNTEDTNEKHSKETEKLIKEIYKSMALTMDLPTRDTSGSECNELNQFKSTVQESRNDNMSNVHNKNNTPALLPQAERKQDNNINPFVRSRPSPVVATFETTLPTKAANKQSQEMSTDTDNQLRKERIGIFLKNNKFSPRSTETELGTQDLGLHSAVSTVSEEEESESSSSETDTDETYVPPKESDKKTKKGIFSKMFKSVFKPKEGKNKKEGSATDGSDVSDSDDYQTIYSQKVEPPPKRIVNQSRPTKPHSKVVTTKQAYYRERKPEKTKRSPYMEQEYRRHWNEKLMFHENEKRRYSSEQPASRNTTPQAKYQSPYYQKYEARSVLHDPYAQYRNGQRVPRPDPTTEKGQQRYPPQCLVRQQKAPQPNYAKAVDNSTVRKEEKMQKVTEKKPGKGLAWLKKHKLGIHCGEQWKKLLIES